VAFNPTEADHNEVNKFIDALLSKFENGDITALTARSNLAPVITAAARDNYTEFKKHIRTPVSQIEVA